MNGNTNDEKIMALATDALELTGWKLLGKYFAIAELIHESTDGEHSNESFVKVMSPEFYGILSMTQDRVRLVIERIERDGKRIESTGQLEARKAIKEVAHAWRDGHGDIDGAISHACDMIERTTHADIEYKDFLALTTLLNYALNTYYEDNHVDPLGSIAKGDQPECMGVSEETQIAMRMVVRSREFVLATLANENNQ